MKIAPPQRPWVYLAAIALVLLVYASFAPRLTLSLTLDEAYTAHFARRLATVPDDTWPPLYYGLIWAVTKLAPAGEAFLRVPSLFAVLGSGVALATLGRRLIGPAPALLAGLGVVLTPIMLRYAFWARGYGLLVFFSTLLTLLTLALITFGVTRWRLAAWVAACLGAAATHHFGALLALSSYLLLALGHLRGEDARRFHRAALCLFVLASPLVLTNTRQLLLGVRAITASRYVQLEQVIKHLGPGAALAEAPWQFIAGLMPLALAFLGARKVATATATSARAPRSLSWFPIVILVQAAALASLGLFGRELWPRAALFTAVVLLLGYVLLARMSQLTRARARLATGLHPLAELVLVMLVLTSLAAAIKPIFTPRNLLVLLPAYYLLAARGLCRLAPRARLIAGALIFAILLASWLSFEGKYGQQEDWRRAIARARSMREPGDFVAIRPAWGEPVLAYYGIFEPSLLLNRADDLCAYDDRPFGVVVLSSKWHHVYAREDWQRLFAAATTRCARTLARDEVAGVEIHRLEVGAHDR